MALADTLSQVRYYLEGDQYYYSVDNRPIYDLAQREVELALAIDALVTTTGRLLRVITFTSSGAYSKNADCNHVEVELWGGGGGLTNGGLTSFGTTLTATGGTSLGVGGTASGGTLNIPGGVGSNNVIDASLAIGGSSPKGGSGSFCQVLNSNSIGNFPGGGGASLSGAGVATGGGGGGYCYWFGEAPLAVNVVVGSAGLTTGAPGLCIIKEYT